MALLDRDGIGEASGAGVGGACDARRRRRPDSELYKPLSDEPVLMNKPAPQDIVVVVYRRQKGVCAAWRFGASEHFIWAEQRSGVLCRGSEPIRDPL